jgi:ssDNA-binding Zn-finger/Zn-ribbon topoisomerase 1
MVVRHNRLNGQAFLGCTGYPSCRGTRNLSNLLLQRAREAIARATVAGGEELRRIEL